MKKYTQKQIEFISAQFQQGQKAIQNGSLNIAEKCYSAILKIDNNIHEAQHALAFVYTFSKQHIKAVTQLKKILQSEPDNANVHHNLANNLYELNNYDEAIIHYQSAIKLNPAFIDSYVQCGMVQRKLRAYDLAIEYLHKAYNLDHSNPKVLHGLGITYALVEDYPHAIEYLSKAVSLAPNNNEFNLCLAKALEAADLQYEADIQYHSTCNKFPDYLDAFLAYGNLLTESRLFNEALECFNHAQRLAPENLNILANIGNSYLSMADTDMAIKKFNDALLVDPKHISSLIGLEQAYQDTGKLKDAIRMCDQIISIDANQPVGYVLKTKVQKSKPEDGLAEHLLKLSNNQELSNDQQIDIHFALGKIYDDQNSYEHAFNHYAIGNALKNKNINYDINENRDRFNQLIEFFNADFFKQHQNIGINSDVPIVIVGMPRSATTLTEQIISSHPDVLAAGEVSFWSTTVRDVSYRIKSKHDYPYCLNDIQQAHATEIAKEYESTLAKISGASSMPKHFTDKMPQNFLNVGLITLIYPNAKIIHTKRDPIDTCLSIFFQNFHKRHEYAFDLKNLGTYYNEYQRLMQHWHQVLPGRIMDINYADTIADPEYWTRQLIDHVGLEWNDACLAPHKLERSVKTASHWQVRQPIYKTSVQRWKNYELHIKTLNDELSRKL
jgi:tetratricopeptide (TPR) repeat protein